ncbi:MAG: CRISPR-associated endonuclease Cas6 [Candidatus Neomarinimicrobiota bacterium]
MVVTPSAETARAICVRFHTDHPIIATPYQLKGVIIRDYSDHPIVPFIDGAYRGQVRYPRVQVKVLRNQLCIFGLGEGYDVVHAFKQQLKSFQIEDQTYHVMEVDAPESTLQLDHQPDNFLRYKFITPWVALNQRSLAMYQALLPKERAAFLNRLLVQNLLFIARELGFNISYTVSARVKLQSLTPRIVEDQGSGSFKGYFTCNMTLPDYLGLGNGITKGLGTIVQI